MPRAQLAIDLPESVWISRVSRTHPDTQFRVLAAFPRGDRGVALLEIAGTDVVAPLRAMRDADAVTELDPVERGDDSVLVQFETDEPLLLASLRDAGLPLEPPVEIRDGEATLQVAAPREKLAALGDQLDALGLSYRVEYLRESGDPGQLLTARQREVLAAAIDAGYYDTPRACTLTELADDLDTAKSALSETLHRAEETAVKQFASDLAGFDDAPES